MLFSLGNKHDSPQILMKHIGMEQDKKGLSRITSDFKPFFLLLVSTVLELLTRVPNHRLTDKSRFEIDHDIKVRLEGFKLALKLIIMIL